MAASHRRGSARAAAKRRRETIFLIVLVVLLAALLAWEVPHLLKGSGAAKLTPFGTALNSTARHKETFLPLHANGDPFQGNPLPNQDAPPNNRGGPDPFKGGPPVHSTQRPIPGQYVIPGHQIVIGRPGGHRVRTHGWIVILASILTSRGRTSAVQFARGARRNVGSLSVLNSSNRRPLRGGYWVVYSGPYKTLDAVNSRAGSIHAAGYRTAYVRELITYR